MSESRHQHALPFDRHEVLALPPLLRRLQAERSITRVLTPTGHQAWYVARYAEVKQLLGDSRLGRSHPDPEHAPRINDSILFGGPAENYETELADHARMRALLTPFFSAQRMEALRPRVEALTDQVLDRLAAMTPPVDLHEALSLPLPGLVTCELLGVPCEDGALLRAWSQGVGDLRDRRRAGEALASLISYMGDLVTRKRTHPRDDVISELCMAEEGTITNDYVAFLGAMLLFTGHETTVARLDLGALLLLTNPEQRVAMLHDRSLIRSGVEEVLRASATGGGGLPRYPRADLHIDGVTLAAGDAVLLDIGAANHDERAFDNPDRFDVARQPNAHLTFGYGPRFCVGAPLARIELQVVFERLFSRLPTLRLTMPIGQLRMREDVLIRGLAELPVTW
jgi:cytochrome P450